jgi:hypothetical protein
MGTGVPVFLSGERARGICLPPLVLATDVHRSSLLEPECRETQIVVFSTDSKRDQNTNRV